MNSEIEEKGRVLRELDLRKLFLLAFGIGVFAIVVSAIFKTTPYFQYLGLMVSILCVGMYAYIGKKQASSDRGQTIEQVADSSYYLGFLFTLTSLITALAAVGTELAEGGEDVILAVLSNFALALSTTIVGLMSKILLTQFDTTLNQQRTKSMGDLTRATAQFATKLSNSTIKVDSYLDATNAKIQSTNEQAVEKLIEISERHNASLLESIEKMNTEKMKIYDSSMQQIHNATVQIENKNNSFVETTGKLTDDFKKNQIDFSNSTDQFCSSISNATKTVDLVGKNLAQQDDLLNRITSKSNEYIDSYKGELSKLTSSKEYIEKVNESTMRLSTSFDRLENHMFRSMNSAIKLAEALPTEKEAGALYSSLEGCISQNTAAAENMKQVCSDLTYVMASIQQQLEELNAKKPPLGIGGLFERNR